MKAWFKQGYSRHDSAHDWEHVKRVCSYARLITRDITLTPNEAMVFDVVMLGHDLLDHKQSDPAYIRREVVDQYTNTFGVDTAQAIMHIHDNCSWSKRMVNKPMPDELAAATGITDTLRLVLEDADRLDAIGEVGLERCIEYTCVHNSGATHEEIRRDVCKHIQEKLLLIPSVLNFAASKQLVESDGMLKPLNDYLRPDQL